MDNTFNEHVKAFGAKQILSYLDKDPKNNIPKTLNLLQQFDSNDAITKQISGIQELMNDKSGKWYKYVISFYNDIDKSVREKFLETFVINSFILGSPHRKRCKEEYDCDIPWVILFDPTSACNMHCTGCWSAEYGNKLNLTFEEMDSIVTQGEELGIHFYIMTGGEPLVRKDDIIKLCKKHSNSGFHIFTNGTLIDEDFCKVIKEVGNITLALSLDGFEGENDCRRGSGTFNKVIDAMDLMKQYKLLYAASICYTSKNYGTVTSDEFIDLMIEKGCKLAWYFHYMPVGNNAVVELMPTKEQREYMYHRIRELRKNCNPKEIFTIDFQNDGEFVGGCIAGGKNYLHINPNGDVEPCVFIHYSSANIKEVSLLEALHQPLFKAYQENQPFNKNLLQPCPMLENPEKLMQLVRETGAKSTDLQSPETVEHLCGKCVNYAKDWEPIADHLWEANGHKLDDKNNLSINI